MKNVIVAVLLGTILLLGAKEVRSLKVNPSLAQLLWDEDEAFLFVDEVVDGRVMSGWQFGGSVALEMLGRPPALQSRRLTFHVIRVTSEVEELRTLQIPRPPIFPASQHRIYTVIDSTSMRWNGTTFEPVDSREWSRFDNGTSQSVDYSDVNGWSNRTNIIGRNEGETRYWLRLAGRQVDIIAVNYVRERFWAVDIERQGAARKRIWSVDGNLKFVSAGDYEAAFK